MKITLDEIIEMIEEKKKKDLALNK